MSRGTAKSHSRRKRGPLSRAPGVMSMMLGVGLLAAALLGSSATAGAESALVSSGWWYQPNQVPNNLAAPPAPPWVPSDGMYVSGAESGPVAIAAVKLVSDGQVMLKLDLTPNGQAGLASVAACVALTNWDGASAGRWEGRPAYDCANEVVGKVSEDGKAMTFALDPNHHQEAGFYNVALVPTGAVPFSTTFNAPTAKSLVVSGGSSVPSADQPEAGSSEESFATGSGFDAADFAGSSADFSAPTEPSVDLPPAAAPSAAGPSAPQVPGGLAEILSVPDDRNQRIAAVAGLGLLLLGAWLFAGRAVRPPRLLGSTASRAGFGVVGVGKTAAPPEAPVRGIGRFAKPRS